MAPGFQGNAQRGIAVVQFGQRVRVAGPLSSSGVASHGVRISRTPRFRPSWPEPWRESANAARARAGRDGRSRPTALAGAHRRPGPITLNGPRENDDAARAGDQKRRPATAAISVNLRPPCAHAGGAAFSKHMNIERFVPRPPTPARSWRPRGDVLRELIARGRCSECRSF